MNDILILGGTGAMGTHLVSILSRNSAFQLYVTSRRERKSTDKITYLQGNAMEWSFTEHLIKERHWYAIIDFMIYPTAVFNERVHSFLSCTDQYLFFSSSRVYANSTTPLTENSPRLLDVSTDTEYLKTDEYALAKAREEDILFNSGRKNWTIIRPYITYSESRLQLGVSEVGGWMYRALKGRTIVFSKDIAESNTTLTYGYDVARGIASVVGRKEAYGRPFHITIDKSLTWEDVLNIYISAIFEKTGKKSNVLIIPKNERLTMRNGGNKWQVKYDRLFNRQFNNNSIKQFIDTSDFLSLEEGLKMCVTNFIENPHYPPINWKIEAYYDRLTNERASISEMKSLKQIIKYMLYRYIMPLSKL